MVQSFYSQSSISLCIFSAYEVAHDDVMKGVKDDSLTVPKEVFMTPAKHPVPGEEIGKEIGKEMKGDADMRLERIEERLASLMENLEKKSWRFGDK